MNPATFLLETETEAAPVARATVLKIAADGTPLCARDGAGPEAVPCQILHTSEGPALRLAPGDAVLVWLSGPEDGVVLGRLGGRRPAAAAPAEAPEELVLEAKKGLTLKCGDGSITLREDGKILIKGKDLVSHARRTNRIKGGAVAIN